MELIETNLETAYNILEVGNRKIKATNGEGSFYVDWINIHNKTFMLITRKGSGLTQNCEDYKFFIQVPKSAKTVY